MSGCRRRRGRRAGTRGRPCGGEIGSESGVEFEELGGGALDGDADQSAEPGLAPVTEELEQVMDGADKAPLAFGGGVAASREAPEAEDGLDGAVDRFNGLRARGVGRGSLGG